jgi:hypothetical protein
LAAIRSSCHRIIHISSSFKNITEEIDSLNRIFQRNGYPNNNLTNKTTKTIFNKWYNNFPEQSPTLKTSEDSTKFYYCTKYYGNVSHFISRQIKNLCHKYFKIQKTSIIFAYKTYKMKNLFKYKDALPNVLRAGVVYHFKCSGCSSTYVGQTSRHLRTRICEHLGISPCTGISLKTNSAIYDHIVQTGHHSSFGNFTVICTATSKLDLPILEYLQIKKLKPDLNRQSDSLILHMC